jgi:hypothetical protein
MKVTAKLKWFNYTDLKNIMNLLHENQIHSIVSWGCADKTPLFGVYIYTRIE